MERNFQFHWLFKIKKNKDKIHKKKLKGCFENIQSFETENERGKKEGKKNKLVQNTISFYHMPCPIMEATSWELKHYHGSWSLTGEWCCTLISNNVGAL